MRVTVAILADSHGYPLPTTLLRMLREVQPAAIIHAGDVAREKGGESATDFLGKLRSIASTTAVAGNTDRKAKNKERLRDFETVHVGNVRLVVHHGDTIVRGQALQHPQLRPADGWRRGRDVIVSGHSHAAHWFRDDASGVHFLNPGSTMQRRGFDVKRLRETPYQAALLRWPATAADEPPDFEVSYLRWLATDMRSGVDEVTEVPFEEEGVEGKGRPPQPESSYAGPRSGKRKRELDS